MISLQAYVCCCHSSGSNWACLVPGWCPEPRTVQHSQQAEAAFYACCWQAVLAAGRCLQACLLSMDVTRHACRCRARCTRVILGCCAVSCWVDVQGVDSLAKQQLRELAGPFRMLQLSGTYFHAIVPLLPWGQPTGTLTASSLLCPGSICKCTCTRSWSSTSGLLAAWFVTV